MLQRITSKSGVREEIPDWVLNMDQESEFVNGYVREQAELRALQNEEGKAELTAADED